VVNIKTAVFLDVTACSALKSTRGTSIDTEETFHHDQHCQSISIPVNG
jgi:hypothetical protein